MDDVIGGLIGLLFVLIGFLFIITLVAGWEILKLGWQLLVWLYKVIQPLVIEAWVAWQQRRWEAVKPAEIQWVSAAARDEIDHIMADYRRQVDDILQTEGSSPETFSGVVLLTDQDYRMLKEDTYVI